jgi:hypothetical protein
LQARGWSKPSRRRTLLDFVPIASKVSLALYEKRRRQYSGNLGTTWVDLPSEQITTAHIKVSDGYARRTIRDAGLGAIDGGREDAGFSISVDEKL